MSGRSAKSVHNVQTQQSLRCCHTQNKDVDEDSDQNFDGWPCIYLKLLCICDKYQNLLSWPIISDI